MKDVVGHFFRWQDGSLARPPGGELDPLGALLPAVLTLAYVSAIRRTGPTRLAGPRFARAVFVDSGVAVVVQSMAALFCGGRRGTALGWRAFRAVGSYRGILRRSAVSQSAVF